MSRFPSPNASIRLSLLSALFSDTMANADRTMKTAPFMVDNAEGKSRLNCNPAVVP